MEAVPHTRAQPPAGMRLSASWQPNSHYGLLSLAGMHLAACWLPLVSQHRRLAHVITFMCSPTVPHCRLALETGSPLVPVFAFGQTPHYSYARPLIDFPRKVVPTGGNPMSRSGAGGVFYRGHATMCWHVTTF